MKKLNFERYISVHILILMLFITIELLVPTGVELEKIVICGYVLVASLFSYFILEN